MKKIDRSANPALKSVKPMAKYGTCGMSSLLPLTSCKTVPCTECHLYPPQQAHPVC